ncbi:MAG: AI-2E family transporter [Patescibacteria group bacterium]
MPSREPITTVNISSLSFVKVLIILAALSFLYVVRDIIAILFISLLFASALSPWIATMELARIPRRLGILFIYVSIVSLISLIFVLMVPPIIEQYNELMMTFPQYSESIVQFVRSFAPPDISIVDYVKQFFQGVETSILQVAGTVFSKIFNVLTGIFWLILIFVVTFYMVAEEGAMKRAMRALTPPKYHDSIDELIALIQHKIGLWLRGQVILSVLIFLASFVGLSILRVEYALILAIFAGLTEFVPILGPIIGSVPAIFVAFNQAPMLALFVILLYFLIQRLENDFLVPAVMKKTVGVNPLVSIIALLIGGKLGGIIGVLLAIPVVTILAVILEYFFGFGEEKTSPE